MNPILFNTDMVRAILAGRKTVTRRVVKPQPNGTFDQHWGGFYKDDEWILLKEPYRPDDILYVRETWARMMNGDYWYKADGKDETDIGLKIKWRPSIHMPREAARIFLRVTDVRVERLQKMTADEAHREGVDSSFSRVSGDEAVGNYVDFSLEKFETLWDSTIKPADRDRYGWAANPWVWVIAFERCKRPEEDAPT